MNESRISTDYPNLAALAKTFGRNLDAAVTPPKQDIDLLGLDACCWWVANAKPRADQAADPYAYLRTFENFLSQFPASELNRKKFWQKLNHCSGSSFLDTVGEATIALELAQAGYHNGAGLQLEVPFESDSGTKKDADIVTTDGFSQTIWMDVVSIKPEDPNLVDGQYAPTAVAMELVDLLATRVRSKYLSKFDGAVRAGNISGAIGIVVCLLKCEDLMAPIMVLQQMGIAPKLLAPPTLWDECPGLTFAFIHTVTKSSDSDCLRPVKFATWMRNPSDDLSNTP